MPPEVRLTLVPPPGALTGANDADEAAQPEDLEAEELRLLARYGTGDHLPAEVRGRVERLRRQRVALTSGP